MRETVTEETRQPGPYSLCSETVPCDRLTREREISSPTRRRKSTKNPGGDTREVGGSEEVGSHMSMTPEGTELRAPGEAGRQWTEHQ